MIESFCFINSIIRRRSSPSYEKCVLAGYNNNMMMMPTMTTMTTMMMIMMMNCFFSSGAILFLSIRLFRYFDFVNETNDKRRFS